MYPKKDKNGALVFADYPDFTPNRTPREVIEAGAFRGTYFRPIYSSVTKKNYKNIHYTYPFFKDIPENIISRPISEADTSINKYDKKVGTTLEFWESKDWIKPQNPYGWFHWYCDFYSGIRSVDDERQIKRWMSFTGPNGRFRNSLINKITSAGAKWNNYDISPAIRQTCLHWAYELTKKDYDAGVIRNQK